MKDRAKESNDLVPLPDYLRRQGCLASPQARAGVMDEIATGKRAAYMQAESATLPGGMSFAAMMRKALAEADKPTHVPASSIPKVLRELERAAMAVDADWNLLNRLLVEVPIDSAKEQTGSQPARHVYKHVKHLGLILDALRDEGFDPKALPPRENGKGTPKAVVRKILVETKKLLDKSQFEHSWEYGRGIKEIAEVASVTT